MPIDINLDVNVARLVHLEWANQVETYLAAGGDGRAENTCQSHEDCDLGIWIHAIGLKKYRHIGDIKTLNRVHVRFHDAVERAFSCMDGGAKEEAGRALAEVQQLSKDVVFLLTSIELHVIERQRKKDMVLHPVRALRSALSREVSLE